MPSSGEPKQTPVTDALPQGQAPIRAEIDSHP